MIQYIITFLAATVVDLGYVWWVKAITANRYLAAAGCSMIIGSCGIVGVTGVVTDGWLAVPWLVGLGVGTILGMKFK